MCVCVCACTCVCHTYACIQVVTNSLQDIPPVKSSISDASGSVTPAVVNLSPAGKFPSTPSLPYPLQPTPSEQHKGHPSSRR